MISDPETEKVRLENAELKSQLEALTRQVNALMGAAPVRQEEWQGERPQYKLIKPFYGPNDVYFDPEQGDEVIEWTGAPNECMEPLNEAARKRMIAWIDGLPGGKTPPLDIIAMAGAMVNSKYGAAAKDLPLTVMAAEIMKMAKTLQAERSGITEETEVVLPHKEVNVPAMGNDPAAQRAKSRKARMDQMVRAVPQPKDSKPKTVIPNVNQSSTLSGA